jgi:hypothetical protein
VKLPGTDLGRAELLGRMAEMAGKAGDLIDVGFLGPLRQVADTHVLKSSMRRRSGVMTSSFAR